MTIQEAIARIHKAAPRHLAEHGPNSGRWYASEVAEAIGCSTLLAGRAIQSMAEPPEGFTFVRYKMTGTQLLIARSE